jgi:pimeloyl-ACP methyl ester carboxylesterase
MLTTVLEPHQGKLLRVARIGSGPPLICLHGYPDNLQIWSQLAPALAASHEVIAFDWPGMGYSEPWPGGATPEHMAERLMSLVEDWKLARAHLLGMDMGGQPALVFAAKYPARTASVIIANSLVIPDARTSWEIALLRKFGWNRFLLRQFPRAIFHRALRTFLPHDVPLPSEVRADFWGAFCNPQVRSFISKMCAGYQGKLQQLPKFYSQIQAPAFILWAEEDGHFPPAHAQQLHQQLQRSELQVVSGGKHWMPLYRAQELAKAICDFLARNP